MILNFIRNGFSGANVSDFITQILLSLPAIIVALSFHEAAHAYVAYRCGDPTAKYYGRLTLNPLKHIDPIGFAMLLLLGFGYAKPVPVNPNNFRHGRRDDILVSVAGIATNLILCLISCVVYVIFSLSVNSYSNTIVFVNIMIQQFIVINISLAVFNLLPIPPLDGSHIFNDLIFRGRAFTSRASAQVGQIVLLVFLVSGAISRVLSFFVSRLYALISWAIRFFS